MIRGTDAQYIFNLPYQCSDVDFVKIIFWQPENNGPSSDRPLPIVKLLNQCHQTDSNQLCVVLDREETLRFSDKRKAYVQLRGTTKSGVQFGCYRKMLSVYPTEDDSLLDDEFAFPSPTLGEYIFLDGQNISVEQDESYIQIDAKQI